MGRFETEVLKQEENLDVTNNRVRFLMDQRVPMRDGVHLSVDVILPAGDGPFPTITIRTPYESNSHRWLDRGVWWAERGYAYVPADCRGRYESEGEFYPYHPDGPDGHDTLEWIAAQPWCNGKIGTAGGSYGGLFQWQLAPLGSPHLTAMAPHVIADDYFGDIHYIGGAFQLGLSLLSSVTFMTNLAVPSFGPIFDNGRIFRHLPLIDMDVAAIGKEVPWYRDWLAHQTYDDYWNEIDTSDKYSKIDAPAFIRCGWFDAYPDGTFRLWNGMTKHGKTERARKGQKVLMGPWTHGEPEDTRLGDLDFGAHSYIKIIEEEKRWFDYWLKGIDNGVMDEPPLKIFVMGTNEWRYENEWPLARTQFTPFYLHSGGRANSVFGDGTLSRHVPEDEHPDIFDYDPDRPVPSIGGNLSTASWPWSEAGDEPIIAGPVDQRVIERRDDVLVYTSDLLEEDVEVTGPLEVVLYAASSAPDTDFTARLIDVHPNRQSIVMAEGIIRARYRHGFDRTQLLEPGNVERYNIQMYPTSNVFLKGHRIRVDISSSNFPRFSRNLNTGEDVATGTRMQIARQTILHSKDHPSHIVLPVIPR